MRISDWSSDVCSSDLIQPVSAARLAIIVSLRGRPAQYLELPVVEAEALIDPRDLRLGGALVGKEYPRRAAFDDRGSNARTFDVGQIGRASCRARVCQYV